MATNGEETSTSRKASLSFLPIYHFITLSILIIIMASSGEALATLKQNEALNSTQAMDVLDRKVANLGHDLFRQMDRSKNIIYSPISIHSALSMLALGVARGKNPELMDLLGYKQLEDDGQSPEIAHYAYKKILENFRDITEKTDREMQAGESRPFGAILEFWTRFVGQDIGSLKQTFASGLKTNYNTSIDNVVDSKDSTRIADEINKWAQKAGFGESIVSAGDLAPMPKTYTLFSAIRIQGFWSGETFSLRRKWDAGFHNLDQLKTPIKADVLVDNRHYGKLIEFSPTTKTGIPELNKLNFRIGQIPLRNGLTFDIIEPLVQETGKELGALQDALIAAQDRKSKRLMDLALEELDRSPEMKLRRIEFPQFKFEAELDLKDLLSRAGLSNLFTGSSGLTEILEDGSPMVVDKAKHQAVIEVEESGLKAAAITQIMLMMASFDPDTPTTDFLVKHPFMFLIRYEKLTLFSGQLVKL